MLPFDKNPYSMFHINSHPTQRSFLVIFCLTLCHPCKSCYLLSRSVSLLSLNSLADAFANYSRNKNKSVRDHCWDKDYARKWKTFSNFHRCLYWITVQDKLMIDQFCILVGWLDGWLTNTPYQPELYDNIDPKWFINYSAIDWTEPPFCAMLNPPLPCS